MNTASVNILVHAYWCIYACISAGQIPKGVISKSLYMHVKFSVGGGAGCAQLFSCVTLFVTLWTLWSPPGSSVHGISQARIPEWVAISSSRGSSPLRDWTSVSWVSWIGRWILYLRKPWATWETPSSLITNGKLFYIVIYKVTSLSVDEISSCPQYHLALSISSVSAILVSL